MQPIGFAGTAVTNSLSSCVYNSVCPERRGDGAHRPDIDLAIAPVAAILACCRHPVPWKSVR
jgi:hypothetical protein